MSTTARLSADGYAIRCPADERVKRASELAIGERFIDRAEDLRARGITPFIAKIRGPDGSIIADAERCEITRGWGPNEWVVSFPR
jgi:DNA-binding MarR family transcriptional regulator